MKAGSRVCCAVLWSAASIAISTGTHAQSSPALTVVSSERFETLEVVGFREPLMADKETVITVALVRGLTNEIMNRIPLRDYFITVGEQRYECLSLDIMPKDQRELVCRAPRAAKELYFTRL